MATLDQIMEALQDIKESINGIKAQPPIAAVHAAPGDTVAGDAELDSEYGDEEIKFKDPPKWTGESYIGKRMSQCSVEYLKSFAGFKSWQAKSDAKKLDAGGLDALEVEKLEKRVGWNARSAARARGWAKRLASGWKPAGGGDRQPGEDDGPDPALPF